MSIVRVGATQKYADGWDAIFGKTAKRASGKKPVRAAAKGRKKAARRKRK